MFSKSPKTREDFKRHPQFMLWQPNFERYIMVDRGLVLVMTLLGEMKINTFFSCQGENVPVSKDHKDNYENLRAYILMKHDDVSHQLIQNMFANFGPMQPGARTLWDIEFSRHAEQGSRVTIRFPKRHIKKLHDFLMEQEGTQEFQNNIKGGASGWKV